MYPLKSLYDTPLLQPLMQDLQTKPPQHEFRETILKYTNIKTKKTFFNNFFFFNLFISSDTLFSTHLSFTRSLLFYYSVPLMVTTKRFKYFLDFIKEKKNRNRSRDTICQKSLFFSLRFRLHAFFYFSGSTPVEQC